MTHPAVAVAAVIASADEEAGEAPKAFIALKPGESATADELMAYVAERVAPHKHIRRLEYVEQIPKSVSGKIMRRLLIEQERARAAQQANDPPPPAPLGPPESTPDPAAPALEVAHLAATKKPGSLLSRLLNRRT